MPLCKNDPKRKYKGDEPSPKGLGWCAHGEKEGKVRKGLDGNKWVVKKVSSGSLRWVKDNTKKITIKKLKKISKNHAIKHKNDLKYKWIKTKQTNDFNFNTYLSVNAKFNKLDTIIELKNKNKNYTLSYFSVNMYDNEAKGYIPVKLHKILKNKYYFNYNLKGKKVQLNAMLTALNNSELLDIEVRKNINKFS